MIIQIRGTGGSGKTWTMERIMSLMGDWQAVSKTGRKQPYWYYSCSEWPLTAVLGHYESACGGCDSIGSAAAVYELTQEVLAKYGIIRVSVNILQEGLLLSEDTKWTLKLHEEGHDLRVLFLDTSVERCLDQIRSRRAEKGVTEPLNETNTRKRVPTIDRTFNKLSNAGILCVRCSPERAVDIVLRCLKGS